jgi:hypothetical protein
MMQRTPVNPWDWSLKLGYNQAEIIVGTSRQLICAGQTAVDGVGNPQHPGDMRGQISLALDNLEGVLAWYFCNRRGCGTKELRPAWNAFWTGQMRPAYDVGWRDTTRNTGFVVRNRSHCRSVVQRGI